MILSVEEAVGDAMREVWPEWIDAQDRMIVWHVETGIYLFHCAHCPEGVSDDDCTPACQDDGEAPTCCCHHSISPSVSVALTILPPEDEGGMVSPRHIMMPALPIEVCATPSLVESMFAVRNFYEERQVLSNLSDVEMSMKAILRGEK